MVHSMNRERKMNRMHGTISREEAIDILTRMSTDHFYGHRTMEAFLLGAEALSAERHGRWTTERTIEHDGEMYCDQCGWTWENLTFDRTKVKKSPYCPNCGAKMDEVTEE